MYEQIDGILACPDLRCAKVRQPSWRPQNVGPAKQIALLAHRWVSEMATAPRRELKLCSEPAFLQCIQLRGHKNEKRDTKLDTP